MIRVRFTLHIRYTDAYKIRVVYLRMYVRRTYSNYDKRQIIQTIWFLIISTQNTTIGITTAAEAEAHNHTCTQYNTRCHGTLALFVQLSVEVQRTALDDTYHTQIPKMIHSHVQKRALNYILPNAKWEKKTKKKNKNTIFFFCWQMLSLNLDRAFDYFCRGCRRCRHLIILIFSVVELSFLRQILYFWPFDGICQFNKNKSSMRLAV